MWVIKIILSAGALGVAAYAARRISRRYVVRELYFSELLLFCEYLSGEINFLQMSLPGICGKYAQVFKSPLSGQLTALEALLYEGRELDPETVAERLPRDALQNDEYDLTVQFFCSLGKSDSESQLKKIDTFKTAFTKHHAGALADKNKNRTLYMKLSMLAAAALVILIL